jgi:Arrestin (or S-antigen), C-terminal domain/Arrestin (or S-antigen), N-terminal domain
VYGAAKCSWTERRGKTVSHFESEEIYLNQKTYFFGAKGAEAVDILPGAHRYDFCCKLPSKLPSSLSVMGGTVSYYVKAVLEVPWGFDKQFDIPFTVHSRNDLNEISKLKEPSKHEESAHFFSLALKTEPLVATVFLPYSGFVPGQLLPVTINYDNKSNVDVFRTKLTLKRTISCIARSPFTKIRTESKKIIEVFGEGVRRRAQKTFQILPTIPMLRLESNRRFCGIIVISYKLIVTVEVSGLHQDIRLEIPIQIGSIPLHTPDSNTCQPPTAQFRMESRNT